MATKRKGNQPGIAGMRLKNKVDGQLKLVTFVEPYYKQERVGFLVELKVVDVNYTYSAFLAEEENEDEDEAQRIANIETPPSILGTIRGGQRSMDAVKKCYSFVRRRLSAEAEIRGPHGEVAFHNLGSIALKAPVPRPGKIIHTAGNFREHAKEGAESGWEFPIPRWISFLKSPSSVIGPMDDIVYPPYTKMLDHEIELAIIIGRRAKYVKKENAYDYIAGFTVFNDITARDIQREEMKSGLLNFGKNLDTFAPLGPCLVPKEEIGDVHNLKIECRVNGEVRQSSDTNHLSVSIPEIVEHYSWVSLEPGDIITTGTVSGVAAFRKEAKKYFLRPGDLLESEIENIGTMKNRIVSERDYLKTKGSAKNKKKLVKLLEKW
jgi:2-keto-4-pentenoate hydratase/2-oxohepta-3-ene-1,7-dioic acid hydratase in catechol pathway